MLIDTGFSQNPYQGQSDRIVHSSDVKYTLLFTSCWWPSFDDSCPGPSTWVSGTLSGEGTLQSDSDFDPSESLLLDSDEWKDLYLYVQ